MNALKLCLICAAATVGLCSAPALAQNASFTGNLANPNDVLLFNFTVGSPSNVTLRTYSYAGGTNSAGTVIAGGGFDPILALFDSSGLEINQNDDGGSNVPADASTGRHYDTFLQSLLNPGSYTVSVQAYSNFAVGPNLSNGFSGGGSFGGRTNFFAFDVLGATGVTQVGGAVPEPATWAMMLLGFGAAGYSLRRKRSAMAMQSA